MGKLSALIFFLCTSSVFGQYKIDKPNSANNYVFVAKVIRIMDGDTMEVLYEKSPIKIRLAHIDCPEKRRSQPYGNNAKKVLSNLCFGQKVNVYGEKYDRYKRLIAVVKNQKNQNINQEMIKKGMAWHFKKYSQDTVYANLELEARKHKIGLWHDPNPTPPWEWRKLKSNQQLVK